MLSVPGLLFLVLLLSAVTFVVVRGGRDARAIALALVAAALVTAANYWIMGHTFGTVQPILVVSEGLFLGLCLVIALRTDRWWPLPIAAFQLATFFSLLTPLFGENLVSYALGVTQGLWAYLQLLILVLGVLRTPRAAVAAPGKL